MKLNALEQIKINVEAKKVFEYLKDLKKWSQWSPWLYTEADAHISFSPENQELPKTMHWKGKIVGEGEIINTKISATELTYDLNFLKPFKSKAKSKFLLKANEDNSTTVTWSLESQLPFFLFFINKMFTNILSKDYKRGLKRLKIMLEEGKIIAKIDFQEAIENAEGFNFSGLRGESIHIDTIASFMEEKFQLIESSFKKENATKLKGYSFCDKANMMNNTFTFTVGFSHNKNTKIEGLIAKDIPNHKALKVTLTGSYDFLEDAWNGIMIRARALKYKANKAIPPYEKYVVESEKDAEKVTEIYYPIK